MAHLGSRGQEQTRLRLRCQALGESSEVTRRESGKENVRCGWVMHATQGSRCTFGRTSTVRSIFLLSPGPERLRMTALFVVVAAHPSRVRPSADDCLHSDH